MKHSTNEKTPRMYLPMWELLKENRGDWIEIECHKSYHVRWLKAIRKEAYADSCYKDFLISRGQRFTIRHKEFKDENILLLKLCVLPINSGNLEL